jgi:hypothetical protein
MSTHGLTTDDHAQIEARGISPREAQRQLDLLKTPPPFTTVLRPCQVGDGIRVVTDEEAPALLDRCAAAAHSGRLSKLVPASGAASRMFKPLVNALERGEKSDEPPSGEAATFFRDLDQFAFFGALAAAVRRSGLELDEQRELSPAERRTVLHQLLGREGLDYAECPKGLIPFHRYSDGVRTPFEEHLVEAADYVRDGQGRCRVHFTVSSQHEAAFRRLIDEIRPAFESRFAAHLQVDFSHQRSATDTLALDLDRQPFRLSNGRLLFRPGGHGALIHNLHALGTHGADIVLLKNIDNVVPDRTKPLVSRWKRLLTGLLLSLEEKIHGYLELLATGRPDDEETTAIEHFLAHELGRSHTVHHGHDRQERLTRALSRPLRVCGLVRNTGEPGGGPFWVASGEGEISLQIVETSQIDPRSEAQQAHLASSTHFSPVDISCALRDHRGDAFDLNHFIDPGTVFISERSHEGRSLRALEHPGLWNGAMAGWNTVFVEVPDETFAPVKTVTDLLRPQHQS